MFTVDVTLLLRGQDVSMRHSEDKPGPESDRHDDSEETAARTPSCPRSGETELRLQVTQCAGVAASPSRTAPSESEPPSLFRLSGMDTVTLPLGPSRDRDSGRPRLQVPEL